LGVCNGFQILCESGLLPGALLKNENQKFICKNVFISSASTENKEALKIPIAHGEGRYYASAEVVESLYKNNQVIYKYCDEHQSITAESNPNGALDNIAGICNEGRNVFGMMPHPERACSANLYNSDGVKVFKQLFDI
jgi:phosphoribosylformylglycinamidine synthase